MAVLLDLTILSDDRSTSVVVGCYACAADLVTVLGEQEVAVGSDRSGASGNLRKGSKGWVSLS